MSNPKPFKPNIAFLKKVEAGQVKMVCGYSPRKGGYYAFKGGEATYEKHRRAGFVNPHGPASLGMPGVVTLTDAGRAFLNGDQS